MEVVVLPTPPFWLATAMTRPIEFWRGLGANRRIVRIEARWQGRIYMMDDTDITQLFDGVRLRLRRDFHRCSSWNTLTNPPNVPIGILCNQASGEPVGIGDGIWVYVPVGTLALLCRRRNGTPPAGRRLRLHPSSVPTGTLGRNA
jgi:hypothetical protein